MLKQNNGYIVRLVNISMRRQNKLLESICKKYPEYATESEVIEEVRSK